MGVWVGDHVEANVNGRIGEDHGFVATEMAFLTTQIKMLEKMSFCVWRLDGRRYHRRHQK